MKIKIIFSYCETIEDVVKIVPNDDWFSTQIFTKSGLHSIPTDRIECIEVLDDEAKS